MHVLNSIYWDHQYLAEYLFVTQESQDWKYHASLAYPYQIYQSLYTWIKYNPFFFQNIILDVNIVSFPPRGNQDLYLLEMFAVIISAELHRSVKLIKMFGRITWLSVHFHRCGSWGNSLHYEISLQRYAN